MKTLIVFLFAILIFIVGCNNKVVPLQQTYQEKPYEFAVASPKEEVWTKLLTLITSNGLAIKTIDKNSGLIITENTSFLPSYAFENKDGSLTNPNAQVVCTKVRGPLTLYNSLKPATITGQWTILMKPANDKTLVDIGLVNTTGKVIIESTTTTGHKETSESYDLTIKSTGVFEKSIEKAFKSDSSLSASK